MDRKLDSIVIAIVFCCGIVYGAVAFIAEMLHERKKNHLVLDGIIVLICVVGLILWMD